MFQFRAFPPYTYLIQCTVTRYCRAGFPHSEISGSMRMCRSPELIAACRVLLRLLMPRHSPCALISLTIVFATACVAKSWFSLNYAGHRRIFYRSNCSCYPIIPQYILLTAFRCHTLCCLAYSHHSLCSVFKVQIPVKDRIKTLKKLLSVLIHSSMVEISGIEPLTSCVQSRRSPS